MATEFLSPPSNDLTVLLLPERGVYQDVALTQPATAPGDPVRAWREQSGNGHVFTLPALGAPATLQSVGGQLVVRFDGATGFLCPGPLITGGSYALYAAWAPSVVGTPRHQWVLDQGNVAGSDPIRLGLSRDGHVAASVAPGVNGFAQQGGPILTVGTWHVAALLCNGTAGAVYLDGVWIFADSNTPVYTPGEVVAVGCKPENGEVVATFYGDLGVLALYTPPAPHSISEKHAVEQWMAARSGVALGA